MTPKALVLGTLLSVVLLVTVLEAAPDSPAVKGLKAALDRLSKIEGSFPAADPSIKACADAIAAAGEDDSAASARALVGVLLMPAFKCASAEVFAVEHARDALVGMGSPEARTEVRDTLVARKRDLRVVMALTEVVGSWQEEASATSLAGLLGERDERVIIAAARALGRVGQKGCIRPLIGIFSTWQERGGEPIEVIAGSLLQITGQSFRTQPDWENWWGANEATWTPASRGGAGTGGTRVREPVQPDPPPSLFEGVEVASRKVVLILDISGSMHIKQFIQDTNRGESGSEQPGNPPDGQSLGGGPPPLPPGVDPTAPGYERRPCGFAQCGGPGSDGLPCPSDDNLPDYYSRMSRLMRRVQELIERFRPEVKFNIVTFSTTAAPLIGNGRDLVLANDRNRRQAIERIAALQCQGPTNALAGLEMAFRFEEADHLIFVTDGAPTNSAGRPYEATRWRELLDEVKRFNRLRHLTIDVVAIAGGHTQFSRDLARENGPGVYVRVP